MGIPVPPGQGGCQILASSASIAAASPSGSTSAWKWPARRRAVGQPSASARSSQVEVAAGGVRPARLVAGQRLGEEVQRTGPQGGQQGRARGRVGDERRQVAVGPAGEAPTRLQLDPEPGRQRRVLLGEQVQPGHVRPPAHRQPGVAEQVAAGAPASRPQRRPDRRQQRPGPAVAGQHQRRRRRRRGLQHPGRRLRDVAPGVGRPVVVVDRRRQHRRPAPPERLGHRSPALHPDQRAVQQHHGPRLHAGTLPAAAPSRFTPRANRGRGAGSRPTGHGTRGN